MIKKIYGDTQNPEAMKNFDKILDESFSKDEDVSVHYGFVLSPLDDERVNIDALITTQKYGVIAVKFSGNDGDDEDKITSIAIQLQTLFIKNKKLRRFIELNFQIQYLCFETDQSFKSMMSNGKTYYKFSEFLDSIPSFDHNLFKFINESLDKMASTRPQKLRRQVIRDDSLGSKIKTIESEVANLDMWQKRAAYEIPDRPQRIRGLAGSGKTVVLALKAAYIHSLYPDADIMVTFYSRALVQQFKALVENFFSKTNDEDIDWDKITIVPAWGSHSEPGFYSLACDRLNITYMNYNEANARFGRNNAFSGACSELLNSMDMRAISSLDMYDYILIDEAQDLPSEFFKLAYSSFKKNAKKNLSFAYDELQTLSGETMPSAGEMFGKDDQDNDLVNFENSNGEPRADIVLPICYRNTMWSLTVAHALGFGIYREKKINEKTNLVQFFDDLSVWNDIGYQAIDGELQYNKDVTLKRKDSATPEYFNKLMKPDEALKYCKYDDYDEEYRSTAKQIQKNITEDELDPDDILVIFSDISSATKHYDILAGYLREAGVNSIMPGINVDRNTFTQKGSITCTQIHRAKGNEKPMVYLLDAEFGANEIDPIGARNMLFTAITRSRAWVRINGIGDDMDKIISEISQCENNNYQLKMHIPEQSEIKHLNVINRGLTGEEQKKLTKINKQAAELKNLLEHGDSIRGDSPELKDLLETLRKRADEDSYNNEEDD